MRRARLWQALAASLALGAGAVAIAQPRAPASAAEARPALAGCRTAQGSVHFDFEGASRSACFVEDERTISILVTPEHHLPINPSPWYAFRYTVGEGGKLTVNVRYLGASHRYAPKWRGRGDPAAFSVAVAKDGSALSITLPPGEGVVSAQPLLTAAHYDKVLAQLADIGGGSRVVLGHSHDRRPIEAVRLGKPDAPRLIILLGRQHPPEVTGAFAMDAFTLTIAKLIRSGAIDSKEFQFLIVPMLNPDGVARGHWRANLGGVDLNRDWGTFTQPETRAVNDWLSRLPAGVKPVLMLDFHSTDRNVFYVQGNEATAQGQKFLAAWLGDKENAFAGYPFSIEPRDAIAGSGTTKNWFSAAYRIPAYTYEVGDDADPAAVRTAAEALAQNLLPALVSALVEEPGR
jgi:Zinc carboxypeptidase